MNTEASSTNPVNAGKSAAQQQLEQHEVPEVLDFIKENGVAIVVGVLVAVIGFAGYTIWRNSQAAQIEAAAALFANAQTVPQFQEVLANYPDTPSASLAQLSLGAAYFDQADYPSARAAFEQFASAYPDHLMVPNARLGIAQSLEAQAQFAEALSAYDSFLAANAGHYLVAPAIFGKARVLEEMGRYDEAIAVYDDFISSNPGGDWALRAETGRDFASKRQRAGSNPGLPESGN
jgi:predicted negative regulator of RcsB-dependent stress response